MNEITAIHPLVKHRLEQCGYSYEHEYNMPDYGRVDFYAQKEGEQPCLIEAKIHNSPRVVLQLAAYGLQMPDARMIIALPRKAVTPQLELLATKYNMEIMQLFSPLSSPALIPLKDVFIKRVQSAMRHIYDRPYFVLGNKEFTQEDCELKFNSELLRLCNDYHEWLSLLDMLPDLIVSTIAEHVCEAAAKNEWSLYRKRVSVWFHQARRGNHYNLLESPRIIKAWKKAGQ